jgi:hypothetical protein
MNQIRGGNRADLLPISTLLWSTTRRRDGKEAAVEQGSRSTASASRAARSTQAASLVRCASRPSMGAPRSPLFRQRPQRRGADRLRRRHPPRSRVADRGAPHPDGAPAARGRPRRLRRVGAEDGQGAVLGFKISRSIDLRLGADQIPVMRQAS